MFNVFKGALLALVREKSVFIWSLAFPLILSTMFVFMFANLDEAGSSSPSPPRWWPTRTTTRRRGSRR